MRWPDILESSFPTIPWALLLCVTEGKREAATVGLQMSQNGTRKVSPSEPRLYKMSTTKHLLSCIQNKVNNLSYSHFLIYSKGIKVICSCLPHRVSVRKEWNQAEEHIGKSKVMVSAFGKHQIHWGLFKMQILGPVSGILTCRLGVNPRNLPFQQAAQESLMMLFFQPYFWKINQIATIKELLEATLAPWTWNPKTCIKSELCQFLGLCLEQQPSPWVSVPSVWKGDDSPNLAKLWEW